MWRRRFLHRTTAKTTSEGERMPSRGDARDQTQTTLANPDPMPTRTRRRPFHRISRVDSAARVRELEAENWRLKQLLADAVLYQASRRDQAHDA